MATTKSTVVGIRLDHERRAWVEAEAARLGVSVRGLFEGMIDEASPAHEVGIRSGMVIVKIGRFAVNSVGEAETLFSKAATGDQADITLLVTQRLHGRLLQTEQAVSVKAR